MIIGVPKETKIHEYRVGIVPAGVRMLKARGHQVLIETNAGVGSGITDAMFEEAGAQIVGSAAEVWKRGEMVMKVKEPIAPEYALMQPKQTVYTYFHLAAVPELAPVLIEKKITAVAYETITAPDGSLPLLQPMSVVAGKMATQVGANLLENARGGKGVLLGGLPGVRRGRVVVLGGGVVGLAAAKIAIGLGAIVSIIDISLPRLEYLDDILGSRVNLLHSNPDNIRDEVRRADLLVGAVLVPGARAPSLVSRKLVSEMEPGSAIVDVAIDQGGCIETIKATSHDNPTYMVDGVIHYGVTNMPGAVAQSSTYGLTNATIKHALALADLGAIEASKKDPHLAAGLNTHNGYIAYKAVADDLKLEYRPAL